MPPQQENPVNIIDILLRSLATLAPPSSSILIRTKTLLSLLSPADAKQARSLLLTLHCLYPHELLPALDLLDRKLVTRLTVNKEAELNNSSVELLSETFYVQSASAVTSKSFRSAKFRKAFNPADTYYEVHLDSWNCSCPAFAYSAFGTLDLRDASVPQTSEGNESDIVETSSGLHWAFGGSLTSETFTTPICKHILAATIGKAAPNLFGEGIETRAVSTAEIAGWAAGWGD